ncbi:MAG: hypothetical protein IJP23_03545 [Oscillospiraceae bacterium]|nr:hypothetical protein [Oscillospiraceae bacterium]
MYLSAKILAHALTEMVLEQSVPELAAAAAELAKSRQTQALKEIRDIVEDGSIPDSTRIVAIFKILDGLDIPRTSAPKLNLEGVTPADPSFPDL